MKQESMEEVQQLLRGTPSEYDGDFTHREAPLIQSSRRWCATIGYFLSVSSVGVLMSSTWLISDSVAKLYGIDSVWVDLFTLSFLISPLFLSLLASFTISLDSLTTSLTIGILLCSVGSWLRSFIEDSFIIALIGQCIASLSVSFFLTAPSFISARWFFPSNRGTATLIMTLSPLIFAYFGPFLSTWIIGVPPSALTSDEIISHYRHRLLFYFKFQAIYTTVSGCVGMLLFQESPSTPPAHSETIQRLPFCKSIKHLCTHGSRLLSSVSAALTVTVYFSFNFLASSLLEIKGMKRQSVAQLYLINIPVAIGVALFFAFLYRLLQRVKVLLLICQAGLLIIIIIALILVEETNYFLPLVLIILQASLFSPILGLTLELICDITFPVGEVISAGFLLGQISFFSALILIAQYYLANKTQLFLLILALAQSVALLAMIFVREDKNPRKTADSDDFILFKRPEEEIAEEESHLVPQ